MDATDRLDQNQTARRLARVVQTLPIHAPFVHQVMAISHPRGWGKKPLRLVDICARHAIPLLILARHGGQLGVILSLLPSDAIEKIRQHMTAATQVKLFGDFIKWTRKPNMLPLMGKRVLPPTHRSDIEPLVPEEKLFSFGLPRCHDGWEFCKHVDFECFDDGDGDEAALSAEWQRGSLHRGSLHGSVWMRIPTTHCTLEGNMDKGLPVGVWKIRTAEGKVVPGRWTAQGEFASEQPIPVGNYKPKDVEDLVEKYTWGPGLRACVGWMIPSPGSWHPPWCYKSLVWPDDPPRLPEGKDSESPAPPSKKRQKTK